MTDSAEHLPDLDLNQLASWASCFVADHGNERQVLHLMGDLGAGKTTLARLLLRALGVSERIKSPSYGLIETYTVDKRMIAHMDLYRLSHPEELEFLDIRDLAAQAHWLLIEWPNQGGDMVPEASWNLTLAMAQSALRRGLRIERCRNINSR